MVVLLMILCTMIIFDRGYHDAIGDNDKTHIK